MPVKPATVQHCSGHIGKLLKVKNSKGLLYKCDYGNQCRFSHTRVVGKSADQIWKIVETFPFSMQEDFKKVLAARS